MTSTPRKRAPALKANLARARGELEAAKTELTAEAAAKAPATNTQLARQLAELGKLAIEYRTARRIVKALTAEADYAAARRRAAVEIADQRYDALRAFLDRMVGDE